MKSLINAYHNNQLTDEGLAENLNKWLRFTQSFVLKKVGQFLRLRAPFVSAIFGASSSNAIGAESRMANEPGASSSSSFIGKQRGILGISKSSIKSRKSKMASKISKKAKKILSSSSRKNRNSSVEVAKNFKIERDRVLSAVPDDDASK